ncbi:M15 family metallopeptidase [Nocardia sp. NPDC049149]|uniref:M15 family metallopeptidase n=1 Tax=Nocardia sp. NPDC049149 TaxID=3364315 RepID=UPI00371257D7
MLRAGLAVVGAVPVGVLVYQSLTFLASSAAWHDPAAAPNGVTVFDDRSPSVINLDADLLEALRSAATDAAADGVEFVVNSGWRSPEYQAQLLREAVSKYGSAQEAARWVAAPTASAHVSGQAVDIGPTVAAAWLSTHGAEYGLCQIYANEPWHYELRPEAAEHGCPTPYADPTQDPRMQQ